MLFTLTTVSRCVVVWIHYYNDFNGKAVKLGVELWSTGSAGSSFRTLPILFSIKFDVFFQAEELKRTCNDFLHNVSEFKKIADSFIIIFDTVSQEVEKEKISAIGWDQTDFQFK